MARLVSADMTDGERLIAWPAVQEGTPILSSDGQELGKVVEVVADRQKDIFSGVTLRSGLLENRLFVPADAIDELTAGEVRLRITAAEAESFKPYED
jgi:hypothetical protein